MKKDAHAARRILIPVLLVLLAATIFVWNGTLAEFTSSKKAKRVLAAYDTGEERFSSDVLQKFILSPAEARDSESRFVTTVPVSGDNPANWPSKSVMVCNYPQSDSNAANETAVTYTMRAEIGKLVTQANGSKVWQTDATATANLSSYAAITINNGSFTNGGSHTLSAGTPDSDTYAIHFTAAICDSDYYLMLTAARDGDETKVLRRLISVTQHTESSAQTSAWILEIADAQLLDSTNDGYDGYNYRLFGSGTGTVTLSWPSNLAEINKYFADTHGGVTTAYGVSSISIAVDSGTKNSYDIQFYYLHDAGSYSTWLTPASGTATAESGRTICYSFTPTNAGT